MGVALERWEAVGEAMGDNTGEDGNAPGSVGVVARRSSEDLEGWDLRGWAFSNA